MQHYQNGCLMEKKFGPGNTCVRFFEVGVLLVKVRVLLANSSVVTGLNPRFLSCI